MPERGRVKFYDEEKGWGFVARDGSTDVFLHRSAVKKSGVDPMDLGEDTLVEVTIVDGKAGKGPKVDTIRLV